MRTDIIDNATPIGAGPILIEPPLFSPPESPVEAPAGWRFQALVAADGSEDTISVPLGAEDTLHPEEGDQIPQDPEHLSMFVYLVGLLMHMSEQRAGRPLVLADLRVEFSDPMIRPLAPDILIVDDSIPGFGKSRATYSFDVWGGRPVMALEIISRSSRDRDLGIKKEFYRRTGIELYVVDRVDVGGEADEVYGFRLNADGMYEDAPLFNGGIVVPLFDVMLAPGSHDGIGLYDAATGEEIPYLDEYAKIVEEQSEKIRQIEARLTEHASEILDLIHQLELGRAAREAAEAALRAETAARRDADRRAADLAARAEAMQRELDELRRQINRPSTK